MPIPEWLEPYADNHDAARANLLTPEIPLFDDLWARACGEAPRLLSLGEQKRLIDFLSYPPKGSPP